LLKGKTKKEWLLYYDKFTLSLLSEYRKNIKDFHAIIQTNQGSIQLIKEKKSIGGFLQGVADRFETKPEKPKKKEKKKKKKIPVVEEEKPAPPVITKGLTDEEEVTAQRFKDVKIPKGAVELETKDTEEMVIATDEDDDVLDALISEKTRIEKKEKEVTIGSLFNTEFIKHIVTRLSSKDTFSADMTKVPQELVDLGRIKSVVSDLDTAKKIDRGKMNVEAKRFKKIISHRNKPVSIGIGSFGSIANLIIKKWSLFLIDLFPEFFRHFYNALKFANIRILSSTYTNIMLLAIISVFTIVFVSFGTMFYLFGYNPMQIIGRTFFMSFLLSVTTFFVFYSYPFMRINTRRRSIKTNLPFTVNHMAAIAGSGVAPDTMFRLISLSDEYGDISLELSKIVEFIDVFGYDLMSAIRNVAQVTPSPELKDFFEGFVSSIETGGDLKNFLKQKADEYMLTYKLERQKFTETISLYSDIYTGVLIAAPLFFVVALSLVNILGGKVGSMNVEMLIAGGTYVLIPLLNIGFIVFLEISQPDI